MKIQLVNIFWHFIFYYPFPVSFIHYRSYITAITARIAVRVDASVCGSRVLPPPFYTPQHISQSMFAICRVTLSRFQFVYDWSVVIYLQFLRSLQTSTYL